MGLATGLRAGNIRKMSANHLKIDENGLGITILISLKILHSVTPEILVKFDIFDASMSSAKYLRISLKFLL